MTCKEKGKANRFPLFLLTNTAAFVMLFLKRANNFGDSIVVFTEGI